MKKILSVFSAAILLLTAVSCLKEDAKITVNPSKGENPILVSSDTEEDIVVEYTPAQFYYGNDAVNRKLVYHALILVSLNGKEMNVNVNAKDDVVANTLTLKAKTFMTQMGASVYGLEDGQQCTAEFVVRGSVSSTLSGGNLDSEGRISYAFEFSKPQGNPWADYTEPSPWGLIGKIASTGNEWNADEAMFMVSEGNKHVAKNIKLGPADQFKVRKGGSWDINFGAPGDTEPYVLAVGESIDATAGGKNLTVSAEGNYDLLLDEEEGTITLLEAFQTYPGYDKVSNWTVIGKIASVEMEWNKDIQMITDGEWHVAEGVVLTTDDQFKFRVDQKWDTNIGATGDTEPFVVSLDEEYSGANGGKNLAVPANGVYDLLCNPATNAFKVVNSLGGKSPLVGADEPEPEVRADWYYHGQSESAEWGELPFTKVSDSEYVLEFTTKVENAAFVLKNGDATKWIGADASQKGEDGKCLVVIGEEFKISEDKVDGVIAEPGDYVFTFNPVDMTAIIKKPVRADWYYHGQSATSDWGELPFKKVSDTEYVLELTTKVENAAFVLKNGDATKWIGADASQKGEDGKVHVEIGKEFKISDDKVDAVIAAPGDYIFTFNPEAMTAVISSARADWYYHGQSASTDWGELPFTKVSDDVYVLDLDVKIDNAGFVLKNGDASKWIGADASLKGEDGKAHIVLGQEFAISDNKVDGIIEKAGKYKMTLYVTEMKAVIATAEPVYCYHGQSKRTPDWGTVPFEKVSDEEYYVIVEVEANYGFVLKTADETSWFGPAASQKGEDGKYHVADGAEFDVSEDKVDAVFDTAGTYKLTYKPATQKAVAVKL